MVASAEGSSDVEGRTKTSEAVRRCHPHPEGRTRRTEAGEEEEDAVGEEGVEEED